MDGKKSFVGAVVPCLTIAVLILLVSLTHPALGQVTFQTRYSVVVADKEADFLEMERRLRFRPAVLTLSP